MRARGGPRTRGRQIGEAAAPLIQQMLTTYPMLLEASQDRLGLSWEVAVSQSREYARYAPEVYLEELRGMAEGAGASLDEAGDALSEAQGADRRGLSIERDKGREP